MYSYKENLAQRLLSLKQPTIGVHYLEYFARPLKLLNLRLKGTFQFFLKLSLHPRSLAFSHSDQVMDEVRPVVKCFLVLEFFGILSFKDLNEG